MKSVVSIAVISLISMTSSFAAIKIDGRLSEQEWKKAQSFTFKAGNPSFDVTALVLWDETYFYFGCLIPDSMVEGKHKDGIQNVWEDNDVEYYLETDNAKFNGRSNKSFQLLFSAAGAYNDTDGDGASYDFAWDSHVEYKVVLEPGTTLNNNDDVDKGWRIESKLPWADMKVNGEDVEGKTMGWNILYTDKEGGASVAYSWSPEVSGFENNHDASNWGEIVFDEGYARSVSSKNNVATTWGNIKL